MEVTIDSASLCFSKALFCTFSKQPKLLLCFFKHSMGLYRRDKVKRICGMMSVFFSVSMTLRSAFVISNFVEQRRIRIANTKHQCWPYSFRTEMKVQTSSVLFKFNRVWLSELRIWYLLSLRRKGSRSFFGSPSSSYFRLDFCVNTCNTH